MERIIHLRPGQRKPTKVQQGAGALIGYAEKRPAFLRDEAERKFGWEPYEFNLILREARLQLAHEDEYNLICEPQGYAEPWLYRLVGNYDEAKNWMKSRREDSLSRIQTQYNVAQAVLRGSTTTLEKRLARAEMKNLGRLIEDIEEITNGGS